MLFYGVHSGFFIILGLTLRGKGWHDLKRARTKISVQSTHGTTLKTTHILSGIVLLWRNIVPTVNTSMNTASATILIQTGKKWSPVNE